MALVTAAGGCDSSGPRARRLSETPKPCPRGGAATLGEVLVMAADDPFNADLYKVCLSNLESTRVTDGARISTVDASGRTVVVADARRGADQVELLVEEQLHDVPGLGDRAGFSPAVSEDGLLAYIRALNRSRVKGEPRRYVVEVWDPEKRAPTVIYSSRRPLASPAWGPDTQLAVLTGRRREDRWQISVLDVAKRGHRRSLPCPVRSPVGIVWGNTSRAAVVAKARSGAIIHLTSGKTTELDKWVPLDWSPDGKALLATDRTRRRLVVVGPTGKDLQVLGNPALGRIFDAAWTDTVN